MILDEDYKGYQFDDDYKKHQSNDYWSPPDLIGADMMTNLEPSRFDDLSYYLVSEEKAQSNLRYVKDALNRSNLICDGSEISKLQWLAYIDIERIYREALEEKHKLDLEGKMTSWDDKNHRYRAFMYCIAPAYKKTLAFVGGDVYIRRPHERWKHLFGKDTYDDEIGPVRLNTSYKSLIKIALRCIFPKICVTASDANYMMKELTALCGHYHENDRLVLELLDDCAIEICN